MEMGFDAGQLLWSSGKGQNREGRAELLGG